MHIIKQYNKFNKNNIYDLHVQCRDYGYMLCNRKANTLKSLISQAVCTYWNLLKSNTNDFTKQRANSLYFSGYTEIITIRDKDGFKGIVIW